MVKNTLVIFYSSTEILNNMMSPSDAGLHTFIATMTTLFSIKVPDNSQSVFCCGVKLNKQHYHLISQMQAWCLANIGPGDYFQRKHVSVDDSQQRWCMVDDPQQRWCMTTAFGNSLFYFKSANDASMFALKWL